MFGTWFFLLTLICSKFLEYTCYDIVHRSLGACSNTNISDYSCVNYELVLVVTNEIPQLQLEVFSSCKVCLFTFCSYKYFQDPYISGNLLLEGSQQRCLSYFQDTTQTRLHDWKLAWTKNAAGTFFCVFTQWLIKFPLCQSKRRFISDNTQE